MFSKILKKQNGVFYTNSYNPFQHTYFIDWANNIQLGKHTVLEPFAGANHIIQSLKDIGVCKKYTSFDICPQHKNVIQQDTITQFPKGYTVCVTNPPWLYKSRAKRLHLSFPHTKWDNLYKFCLELCLHHCEYVAILIPASFLNSNIFLERLDSVIVLQKQIFSDTDNPVCLALFNKENTEDTCIFIDDKNIGTLTALKQSIPKTTNIQMKFNDIKGNLGLVAIDNTQSPSIFFCKGEKLNHYTIRHSSRSITRAKIQGIDVTEKFIEKLNKKLNKFRKNTHDIFMTPFKGIRKDGKYRRRLDYSLAKKIVGNCV